MLDFLLIQRVRGARYCRPLAAVGLLLSFSGCTGVVSGADDGGAPGAGYGNPGALGGAPGGGAAGTTGTAGIPGNMGMSGGAGAGGTGTVPGGGAAGSTSPSASGGAEAVSCTTAAPGRSPLRRLTTYEYNNTIRDLLGDTTNPGNMLPAQVDSRDNWFGNDADYQSASDTLVEKYQSIAEGIAARATADTAALGRLHACAGKALAASEEEACARSIASAIAPKAFRRTTTTADIDDLVGLYRSVRAASTTVTFASGVAAMLEAILQSPEFLYRVETGKDTTGSPTVKRLTGREMATRLSYLFWQTMPDPALFQAADAGMLDTNEGVLNQAKKLLDDERSRATVAFFFDNFLPIPDLAGLARDSTQFPAWSPAIGSAMHQEVQKALQHEIFENTVAAGSYQPGSWPALLVAPYTFVNKALFDFYGASAFAAGSAVAGTDFVKVNLNTDQRLGLLTLGGIMAGGTTSNHTNPVLRGSFIVNKLMCLNIDLPTGFSPPEIDPYSGKTARERVAKHTQADVCATCHKIIDPLGLPFENYDPIGRYRSSEVWTDPMSGMTYDTPIDASGSVPGVNGVARNGVELVRLLASSDAVQNCFASHWMRFAFGRSLDSADSCNRDSVQSAFKTSGYNVKQLLLALTQSDAFLYRSAE